MRWLYLPFYALFCLFPVPRALLAQFVKNIQETPESIQYFFSAMHIHYLSFNSQK